MMNFRSFRISHKFDAEIIKLAMECRRKSKFLPGTIEFVLGHIGGEDMTGDELIEKMTALLSTREVQSNSIVAL